MITVKRSTIIQKLQEQSMTNYGSHKQLVNDAMSGQGDQAMAYLVKNKVIGFSVEELRTELNHMVEHSLLSILQWEKMLELLDNARNGEERVTNFLRRKRRIAVVG